MMLHSSRLDPICSHAMASKQPIVKQIAWLSIVPQFFIMALIYAVLRLMGAQEPLLECAIVYLIISFIVRRSIPQNHRKAIALFKKKNYAEAIGEFKKSYDFFQAHPWIDKYRYLTLLSSSRIGYREMALLNVAYCYGQIGEGVTSKEYYEKTLSLFPGSEIALASLKMFEAAENIPNKNN